LEGFWFLVVVYICGNKNKSTCQMDKPVKPDFDEFVKTCTPLLKIPDLEARMRIRVQKIVDDLLDFEPSDNPVENLKQFLRKDENFLGVLLALSNLSQEKLLRIISAKRFAEGDFGPEWGSGAIFRRIKGDDDFAEMIAKLFVEGSKNTLLSSNVADFYLAQLSLPKNWLNIIRDDTLIGNVVRRKLAGEYADQKGAYIEKQIVLLLDEMKVRHAHGQVRFVGKEIDHAIPDLNDPCIMVMVSYLETTSSTQTKTANEQQAIFQRVIGENVRYAGKKERIFVNFADGGGWLARRSDLRKIHAGCHFCLNFKTLDQLEKIIRTFAPINCFV